MKWLFERSAATWAEPSASAHRWRGLSLYGMDGSSVRVPDHAVLTMIAFAFLQHLRLTENKSAA